jgi:hypothetical protein
MTTQYFSMSNDAQLYSHFIILYICILSHIVISLSLHFFRLCAACQCLKHFTVFSTLVAFLNLQNHYMFRPELAILRPKHVVILKILKSDKCWEHYKVFQTLTNMEKESESVYSHLLYKQYALFPKLQFDLEDLARCWCLYWSTSSC